MKNDLISRSALIAEHCAGCDSVAKGLCYYDICGTAKLIMEAPTVDAVEVVHGRWINKTKELHGMVDERNDCSNCGQVYWFACPDFNYCPNCGAKMEG